MTTEEKVEIIRETAWAVRQRFVPGYLEKVYENALGHRLEKRGLQVRHQVPIVVRDEDGFVVGDYIADLLVDDEILIEIKATEALHPKHLAQALNYLKATGLKHGILINFGGQRFEIKKLISTPNGQ